MSVISWKSGFHTKCKTTRAIYVQRNTEACVVQPLLLWKGNKYYIFWVCVCSVGQPACSARAPYCNLCPALFHSIFPYLSHKRYGLKKIERKAVCFDFLCNFCLKHFSFQGELSEIWSKTYIGLLVKYPLFLSNFNETCIFSAFFWKIVKYYISWKSSSGNRVVACGPTDTYDEANSRIFTKMRKATKKECSGMCLQMKKTLL
jgi:hypothetical protein